MKKLLWPFIILLFFLALAFEKIAVSQNGISINLFLFLIILFYCSYRVFNNLHAYSLNLFFWIFNLVFFGYIGAFQYVSNSYAWAVTTIDDQLILEVNLYILIGLVTYDLVYNNIKAVNKYSTKSLFTINYNKTVFIYVGLFIYLICAVLLVAMYGIHFTRYEFNEVSQAADTKQDQALLTGIILRTVILFYCMLCIHFWRQKKLSGWFTLVVLILGILTNFPTTVSRNFAGVFYIGLLFNCYRIVKARYKKVVPLTLLAVFFVVFPILTAARYEYFNSSYVTDNFSSIVSDSYKSADFDAYTMFCQTVYYTHLHGVTWGHQLMGVLFFFIPRNVWPGKPMGSGYFVGQNFKFSFLNLSCPYMAEGYINFGILGLLIFVILLAVACKKFDSFYWKSIKFNRLNNYGVIIYPCLLGSIVFILRGDLLSSWAYTFGLLVTALFFHLLLRIKF